MEKKIIIINGMRKDVCEYVGVDVHARECEGESEQAKDKEREEKRK